MLVEAGGFRVDRRRALEKLRDYQLPASAGLLVLVRCAVAGRASFVRIRQQACWLELRFDGEPFPYKRLSDPLGCLFEEKVEPRERYLALGLLRLLRERPESIRVASGQGARRANLVLRGLDEDSLEQTPEDEEAETVIQASWPTAARAASLSLQLPPEEYARWLTLCPAAVSVDESLVHDPAEDLPAGARFRWDGARGVLALPERLRSERSALDVSVHGVGVASIPFPDDRVRARAWVDDDRLVMNAAMTGIARDERCEALLAAAARKGERLARLVAAGQAERMAALGRALLAEPRLREYWRRSEIRVTPAPPRGDDDPLFELLRGLFGRRSPRADRARFLEDAHATLWLRELVDRGAFPDRPVLEKLAAAPLLLDARGRPLSLRALAGEGPVLYAVEPRAAAPERAVWCVSKLDLDWLKRRFRDRVRPLT